MPEIRGYCTTSCGHSQSSRELRAASAERFRSLTEPSSTDRDCEASDVLLARADKLAKEAKSEASQAESLISDADVETRIALELVKVGHDAPTITQRWDKNAKGTIGKMEFRQGIRGAKANGGLGLDMLDVKDIDVLFIKFDEDKSELLDVEELTVIVDEMQRACEDLGNRERELRENAVRLRSLADRTREAARATERAENAEAALEAKRVKPTADEQLGRLIVKRAYKIGDIIVKWDTDGNGSVSKDEFRIHCRALGVSAKDEEFDQIFDKFDPDRDGNLVLTEVKAVLVRFREVAKANQLQLQAMHRTARNCRRQAKKLQLALDGALEA